MKCLSGNLESMDLAVIRPVKREDDLIPCSTLGPETSECRTALWRALVDAHPRVLAMAVRRAMQHRRHRVGRVTTEGSPHVNLGQSSESQMRLGAPWNTQSRRPQLKRQNAIMRNDLRFMSYGEKPYEIELLECNLQRIWNDKHERTFYGYLVLGENIVATRRNNEELLIIDCAYGYLNTLARVKDYGEKSNGTIIRLRENDIYDDPRGLL